jgi:hypothetical protein
MKPLQRLAVNLVSAAGLGLLLALMACSGATPLGPVQKAQPARQPDFLAKPRIEPEPPAERIPVGSPVVIRHPDGGGVYAFDSEAALSRLNTFLKANDRRGEQDLIAAGRIAVLKSGSFAKLISYRGDDVVEVRVQSAEQYGKLWLVPAECVEDNRTTPDDIAAEKKTIEDDPAAD